MGPRYSDDASSMIRRLRRIRSQVAAFVTAAVLTLIAAFSPTGPIVTPAAVVLAESLFSPPAHAQTACENPDTDFDSDDPDPCVAPTQVEPSATGPSDAVPIDSDNLTV